MKKIIATLLSLLMLFTFCSCFEGQNADPFTGTEWALISIDTLGVTIDSETFDTYGVRGALCFKEDIYQLFVSNDIGGKDMNYSGIFSVKSANTVRLQVEEEMVSCTLEKDVLTVALDNGGEDVVLCFTREDGAFSGLDVPDPTASDRFTGTSWALWSVTENGDTMDYEELGKAGNSGMLAFFDDGSFVLSMYRYYGAEDKSASGVYTVNGDTVDLDMEGDVLTAVLDGDLLVLDGGSAVLRFIEDDGTLPAIDFDNLDIYANTDWYLCSMSSDGVTIGAADLSSLGIEGCLSFYDQGDFSLALSGFDEEDVYGEGVYTVNNGGVLLSVDGEEMDALLEDDVLSLDFGDGVIVKFLLDGSEPVDGGGDEKVVYDGGLDGTTWLLTGVSDGEMSVGADLLAQLNYTGALTFNGDEYMLELLGDYLYGTYEDNGNTITLITDGNRLDITRDSGAITIESDGAQCVFTYSE